MKQYGGYVCNIRMHQEMPSVMKFLNQRKFWWSESGFKNYMNYNRFIKLIIWPSWLPVSIPKHLSILLCRDNPASVMYQDIRALYYTLIEWTYQGAALNGVWAKLTMALRKREASRGREPSQSGAGTHDFTGERPFRFYLINFSSGAGS